MAESKKRGEIVYFEGSPMSIHCNMQTGGFTEYGDSSTEKKSLEINLIGWRYFRGKMWQKLSDEKSDIDEFIKELKCDEDTAKAKEVEKNTKDWVEIFFVNNSFDDKNGRKNPLCVMLCKTYSLASLTKEIKKNSYQYREDGTPIQLHEFKVKVTTKPETKNGKKFFIAEFAFQKETNEEVIEAIENFLDTKPYIYSQENLEEILRNKETYRLQKKKNWALPPEYPNREFFSSIPVTPLISNTAKQTEAKTTEQPQEQE